MFRSGTTLLAKLLSANKNTMCVSDPFYPFFKQFRNEFLNEKTKEALNSPLGDYVMSENSSAMYKRINGKTFEEVITTFSNQELINKIGAHCKLYSPKIINHLSKIKGDNYQEIFSCFGAILKGAYKENKDELVGFKEVWINEFSEQCIKSDKNLKLIFIIRDPRSIVASNFSSGSAYPILFLIRQWRKTIGHSLMLTKKYPQNTILIRYEDLITKPEIETAKICRFLDLDLDADMLDPSQFKDGLNNKWIQNSSQNHKINDRTKFNTKSVNGWQKTLNSQSISLIETLCDIEMKLCEYEISGVGEKSSLESLIKYKQSTDQIAEWIKPYSGAYSSVELYKEIHRNKYLDEIGSLRSDDLDYYYGISPEIVSAIT